MLDDPTSPPIRRSFTPSVDFTPRYVDLKDGTKATILPFTPQIQPPPLLIAYLCSQLAKEIEQGDTYPMLEPLPVESFGPYWFGLFAAVMFVGEWQNIDEVISAQNETAGDEQEYWRNNCLGSFYVKPNYPGRSSHVCNAGFLVTDASRGKGVGKLMGKAYLDWAPKLVRDNVRNLFAILLIEGGRAIHIPCSILFTKPMLHPVVSGTP